MVLIGVADAVAAEDTVGALDRVLETVTAEDTVAAEDAEGATNTLHSRYPSLQTSPSS